MVVCCVPNCNTSSDQQLPGLTFHLLPKNAAQRDEWCAAIGLKVWLPNENYQVCSMHFEDNAISIVNDVPTLAPNSLPKLLLPATTDDLDLFKKKLIELVADLMLKQKKPEDEVWKEVNKTMGRDCQCLWTRMRALTLKKLDRLLSADDYTRRMGKVTRMSPTDWFMFDNVLVHQDIDVLHLTDTKKRFEDLTCHRDLFNLIQRFFIESVPTDDASKTAALWNLVTQHYNVKGRECSPMLLQLRWHQLKQFTRKQFYLYWTLYAGSERHLDRAQVELPLALQTDIAAHCPYIITTFFKSWQKCVEEKKYLCYEDFVDPKNTENSFYKKLKQDEKKLKELKKKDTESDVLVLEPSIETITLEDDSDKEESTGKNTKVDDNLTPAEIDNRHDGHIKLTENHETPIENEVTTLEDKIINDEIEILNDAYNKSEIESESTTAAHALETHLVEDGLSNIKIAIVTQVDDVDLTKDTDNKADKEDVADSQIVNETIDIKIESDTLESNIDIHDEPILQHKGHENEVIQDIIDRIIDNDLVAQTDDVLEIPAKSPSQMPPENNKTEEDEEIDDLENDPLFTINFDDNMMDMEVEKIMHDVSSQDNTFESKTLYNSCNDVDGDNQRSQSRLPDQLVGEAEVESRKIDLKLIMDAVVYTTRLEDMKISKTINVAHVVSQKNIDEVLAESKPVCKKPVITELDTNTGNDVTLNENDNVDDFIKLDPFEQSQNALPTATEGINKDILSPEHDKLNLETQDENSDSSESDVELISIESNLFKKVKVRTYNPIQLCKNPDFNVRLRRLPTSFYVSPRNRSFLRELKPMTIDLDKRFESKLINNTIYFEPTVKIKQINECQLDDTKVLADICSVKKLNDNSNVTEVIEDKADSLHLHEFKKMKSVENELIAEINSIIKQETNEALLNEKTEIEKDELCKLNSSEVDDLTKSNLVKESSLLTNKNETDTIVDLDLKPLLNEVPSDTNNIIQSNSNHLITSIKKENETTTNEVHPKNPAVSATKPKPKQRAVLLNPWYIPRTKKPKLSKIIGEDSLITRDTLDKMLRVVQFRQNKLEEIHFFEKVKQSNKNEDFYCAAAAKIIKMAGASNAAPCVQKRNYIKDGCSNCKSVLEVLSKNDKIDEPIEIISDEISVITSDNKEESNLGDSLVSAPEKPKRIRGSRRNKKSNDELSGNTKTAIDSKRQYKNMNRVKSIKNVDEKAKEDELLKAVKLLESMGSQESTTKCSVPSVEIYSQTTDQAFKISVNYENESAYLKVNDISFVPQTFSSDMNSPLESCKELQTKDMTDQIHTINKVPLPQIPESNLNLLNGTDDVCVPKPKIKVLFNREKVKKVNSSPNKNTSTATDFGLKTNSTFLQTDQPIISTPLAKQNVEALQDFLKQTTPSLYQEKISSKFSVSFKMDKNCILLTTCIIPPEFNSQTPDEAQKKYVRNLLVNDSLLASEEGINNLEQTKLPSSAEPLAETQAIKTAVTDAQKNENIKTSESLPQGTASSVVESENVISKTVDVECETLPQVTESSVIESENVITKTVDVECETLPQGTESSVIESENVISKTVDVECETLPQVTESSVIESENVISKTVDVECKTLPQVTESSIVESENVISKTVDVECETLPQGTESSVVESENVISKTVDVECETLPQGTESSVVESENVISKTVDFDPEQSQLTSALASHGNIGVTENNDNLMDSTQYSPHVTATENLELSDNSIQSDASKINTNKVLPSEITQSTNENEKKNVLSQLMEMSGISEEDITSQIETSPSHTQSQVLQESPNNTPSNLTQITSFAALWYAYKNNGTFYKLDLKTAALHNVNIKITDKRITQEPQIVDLTEEDQKTVVLSSSDDESPEEQRPASPQRIMGLKVLNNLKQLQSPVSKRLPNIGKCNLKSINLSHSGVLPRILTPIKPNKVPRHLDAARLRVSNKTQSNYRPLIILKKRKPDASENALTSPSKQSLLLKNAHLNNDIPVPRYAPDGSIKNGSHNLVVKAINSQSDRDPDPRSFIYVRRRKRCNTIRDDIDSVKNIDDMIDKRNESKAVATHTQPEGPSSTRIIRKEYVVSDFSSSDEEPLIKKSKPEQAINDTLPVNVSDGDEDDFENVEVLEEELDDFDTEDDLAEITLIPKPNVNRVRVLNFDTNNSEMAPVKNNPVSVAHYKKKTIKSNLLANKKPSRSVLLNPNISPTKNPRTDAPDDEDESCILGL